MEFLSLNFTALAFRYHSHNSISEISQLVHFFSQSLKFYLRFHLRLCFFFCLLFELLLEVLVDANVALDLLQLMFCSLVSDFEIGILPLKPCILSLELIRLIVALILNMLYELLIMVDLEHFSISYCGECVKMCLPTPASVSILLGAPAM